MKKLFDVSGKDEKDWNLRVMRVDEILVIDHLQKEN